MPGERIVDIGEFRERCRNAYIKLRAMALDGNPVERARLEGKASGVMLALEYLEEQLRGS